MVPPARISRLLPALPLAWTAGIVVVALARTLGAPAPAQRLVTASPGIQRAIFDQVVRAEPALRKASREAFPGDRWSADDEFHSRESELVAAAAREHGVSEAAAWDALDAGLRAGWPGAEAADVLHGAPPCHPRPTD